VFVLYKYREELISFANFNFFSYIHFYMNSGNVTGYNNIIIALLFLLLPAMRINEISAEFIRKIKECNDDESINDCELRH